MLFNSCNRCDLLQMNESKILYSEPPPPPLSGRSAVDGLEASRGLASFKLIKIEIAVTKCNVASKPIWLRQWFTLHSKIVAVMECSHGFATHLHLCWYRCRPVWAVLHIRIEPIFIGVCVGVGVGQCEHTIPGGMHQCTVFRNGKFTFMKTSVISFCTFYNSDSANERC